MTKMEFAEKLEKYESNSKQARWGYLLLGLFCFYSEFAPETFFNLGKYLFEFPENAFWITGVFSLFKSFNLFFVTTEQQLLIDAMELLSSDNNQT
jgi:hypothetical protein